MKQIVKFGTRFGKLTVGSEISSEPCRSFYCLCDCGKLRIIEIKDLKNNSSCGCKLKTSKIEKDIKIIKGDCLQVLKKYKKKKVQFDAIITDPPYEIGLHGKSWDSTGITFSPKLWKLLFNILKPGGFIVSFSASRLYHRVACVAEDAGFKVYPMLNWVFDGGLPKPANLSELFDREVKNRKSIGSRKGSGFTNSNVIQGAQNRSKTNFIAKERYLTKESRKWKGFYYGVNCLKPAQEPIFIGQKKPEGRMVDNIRKYGVGALNLQAIQEKTGLWPTSFFKHKKSSKKEHKSNHPSVKPVNLMDDLCALLCPPGGIIIDPFAGTGSTGLGAINNNLRCVLIEKNPEMIPVIKRRVKEQIRVSHNEK